jgi:putative tryptophan/tyrosine transport system substrate-binding protein
MLGSAVVTLPFAARAQQGERAWRIGALMGYAESDREAQTDLTAFREGLQKLGWAEGRNIRIETRWAPPENADFRELFARELVELKPDLILSHTTPTTAALLRETHSIPIIFANVSDPVGSGFVASLSRPGGNVTGFTTIENSMGGKWLELLKEISPHVNRVAFLFNPETATYAEYYLNLFKTAGTSFGVDATPAPVRDKSEIETVMATLAGRPDGLVVMPDSFLIAHRAEITSLAASYHVPAVYPFRFFAEVGGLLAYGVDLSDNFGRAALYADCILKGDKPGKLPVQGPTKFEFVINLKTAKALGLDVPATLLARADEVIE